MRRLSPAGLVLVLSVTACGAAPTPALSKNEAASAHSDAGVQAALADVRVPSATLARYWPFTGPLSTDGYVDVAGMSTTVAGDTKVLLPILALIVDAKRKDSALRCAGDALGHTREIVFGGTHADSLFAIAAVPGGAQMIVASCFDDNPSFAKAAPLPGADQGWTGNDSDGSPLRVARVADVILFGAPSIVTGVVAPSASPHPLPSSFALERDQYAVLDAAINGSAAAHFTLTASQRHLSLETDIAVGDASAADLLAEKIRTLTTWPPNAFEGSPTPAITDSLHRLSKALTIESRGGTVKARFELVEAPEWQAYDVAIGANLTASLVHYSLRQEDLAEARATLPGIAQRYAEATEEIAKKNHAGKRLKSYPPVPAQIPAGKAVVSTAADWRAWKPLSVELSDPQSFQYEIVADKKGTAADVVARGFLEGESVASTLKVRVAIDAKSHEIVVGDVVEEPKNDD